MVIGGIFVAAGIEIGTSLFYAWWFGIQELCATLKDDTTDRNEQENERKNANASAKSKELHPSAQSKRNAAHLLLLQMHFGLCINLNELRTDVIYKKCFSFSQILQRGSCKRK